MSADREVRILPNAEAVAHAGADEFIRAANETLARRDRFSVVLAGGSTPRRMLELLSGSPRRDRVDWSRVVFFFGDERTVPPDHIGSNFRMARETLLDSLDLRPGQAFRMHGEDPDPDAAARDYERRLREALGGDSGPPTRFDLVYLGIGEDGHTASLFPGTEALTERTRWVVANEVPQLRTTRITLTYPAFAEAGRILFMACGSAKAHPLAEILAEDAGPDPLPAARVAPRSGQLIWLLDEAAASKLV